MADKFKEIGAILAAARRDRDKTLKDAEENTKIMAAYLEAIEAGEPGKLPAQEYFMLFSRSYAQYLGVDPAVFDEIEDVPIDEKPPPKKKGEPKTDEEPSFDEITSETPEKRFGKMLIYVVSAIIVIFAAFLVYTQVFMKSNDSTSAETSEEMGTGDRAEAPPEEQGKTDFTYPDQPWQPPEKLTLEMVAKQNVWAVVARDGDTVMNRELLAGQRRQWEAEYRFSITVGISSAVDLFLNGRRMRPLSDRARTVKDLEINQVNYEQFVASDTNQAPVMPSPVQEAAPVQAREEEESWIERRSGLEENDTVGQRQQTDTNLPPPPPEEESWIELPPDTTQTDTTSTEAPDGN